VTIPSDDLAFREHVNSLARRHPGGGPAAFEARLRRLFPRAAVRAREISSEPEVWYVYRDGSWRPSSGPWWTGPLVPELMVALDGWVHDANPAARSLLGIDDARAHHYSDFLLPEAAEDASVLFDTVGRGHVLTATVLLRPLGGELIACEVRAEAAGGGVRAWLRLADEVDVGPQPDPVALPRLETLPADDTVFAGYAARQLTAMADPSVHGLGLRLRRMFPHARVTAAADDRWVADRDGGAGHADDSAWWTDPALPRVRFDDRGLILEANPAAVDLLGVPLVGHHWHEYVTPGSQDEVQSVIDLLRDTGAVASRFRMPAADGHLVEFDSYTRPVESGFETTMRPLGGD
jgi:PAS domain-containing protein